MATPDLKRSPRSPQPVRVRIPSLRLATPLSAIQHIRRMRGTTQAHLMRASDGCLYVVKFQNNPMHPRVLANEFLATRLGLWLGLPMAQVEVIEVSGWLIAHSPALLIELGENRIPCGSGLQLASRYLADPTGEPIQLFDHLPNALFRKVANRQDLVQALVVDKWLGNTDSRQVLFTRRSRQSEYHATLIDQGMCFDGSQWAFPDLPLMGTYEHNRPYREVTGWRSFQPMLSRIENVEYKDLWRMASEIPQEWYQYDAQGIYRLIGTLYKRRRIVRSLISKLRRFEPEMFPRW